MDHAGEEVALAHVAHEPDRGGGGGGRDGGQQDGDQAEAHQAHHGSLGVMDSGRREGLISTEQNIRERFFGPDTALGCHATTAGHCGGTESLLLSVGRL